MLARLSSRTRERGMVTVLIVLLAALALTATAIGVISAIRGAQDRTLALHTSALTQDRAWSGVEMVRQYLLVETLSPPPWSALPWSIPVAGVPAGSLTARVVAMTGPDASGTYQVVADITGSGANSSTSVRAVYAVTPATSGGGGTPPTSALDAANFYYDINMTGGISILGGDNASINVLGNATLDHATIFGLNRLQATGNVVVGSGIHINQLVSNGTVTLTGSAQILSVSAIGNIIDNSSANIGALNTNGTVAINNGSATTVNAIGAITASSGGISGTLNTNGSVTLSNGAVKTINAQDDVSVTGGIPTTINTMGSVMWTSTGGGSVGTTINANGTVTYSGTGGTINSVGDVSLMQGGANAVNTDGNTYVHGYGGINALQGEGNVQIDQYGAVTGTVGGTVTKLQQYNLLVNVRTVANYRVPITPVALADIKPLQPFVMSRPTIDAYPLKASANYAFSYDPAGYTKVTVSDINNLADGDYVLLSDSTKKDFLCPIAKFNKGQGACKTNGSANKTLCQGFSPQNSCFSHDTDGALDRWTVAGTSLAPGIFWFDGSFVASSGTYFNTFVATGNITTSGVDVVVAPNFAGYQVECNNSPSNGVLKNADFAGMYPTQLCNTASGTLVSNTLANVALLAGGYKNGVFQGGNITLGSTSATSGTIAAGNVLNTGGSAIINGYVTAAGEGVTTSNSLSGSTTINLANAPSSYQPGVLPCVSNCSGSGTAASSKVVWTRYQ